MKTCVNCRYYDRFRSEAFCCNSLAPDYTGVGANAYAVRSDARLCGPAGAWFEEKTTRQVRGERAFNWGLAVMLVAVILGIVLLAVTR